MAMTRWVNRADTIRTLARQIRHWTIVRHATNRRRYGRLKADEALVCNLGKVLDVSAGGMRLLSRRPLNGTVEIALWDIRWGITLRATVGWTRRLGFRRHESGLEFIDVDADTAQRLAVLAVDNRRCCPS